VAVSDNDSLLRPSEGDEKLGDIDEAKEEES
jgi:hypothetical protein